MKQPTKTERNISNIIILYGKDLNLKKNSSVLTEKTIGYISLILHSQQPHGHCTLVPNRIKEKVYFGMEKF